MIVWQNRKCQGFWCLCIMAHSQFLTSVQGAFSWIQKYYAIDGVCEQGCPGHKKCDFTGLLSCHHRQGFEMLKKKKKADDNKINVEFNLI